MKSFEWANATSVDDAVKLLAMPDGEPDPDRMTRPIGGGQDLHTTMKSYITTPPRVVNLKTIAGLNGIAPTPDGGLRVGALVTLTQLATDPRVAKQYPGLAEAALAIATPQIRNLGTVGGNLGQRPRCWYFRLEDVTCLKRGGAVCYAKDGENKYNAIFATDGPCVIVHPSDLAPMLTALGATVNVTGPAGPRAVPIGKFFKLPADGGVRVENVLGDGDVVTDVVIPAPAGRSAYLKFKERESLDFAMASVAAVVSSGKVSLVLGGVAPVPWRCEKAEAFLAGKTLDEPAIAEAARLSTDGAKPLAKNGYKVPLTQALVRRALTKLATA
jgi:xanthine dehydrogenase YagS FAD-binding subunit